MTTEARNAIFKCYQEITYAFFFVLSCVQQPFCVYQLRRLATCCWFCTQANWLNPKELLRNYLIIVHFFSFLRLDCTMCLDGCLLQKSLWRSLFCYCYGQFLC